MVDLSARPELGQAFVTGDVVNTAARIESAAPAGRVAVGEATFHATERVFEFTALEPVLARGKAKPVKLWLAGAAKARLGVDVIRSLTTPLVGRDIDLDLLRGSFDKVVRQRTVQMVTVVGEPGVGKSRLVAELGAHVERGADSVTWRQGRCLPYGEGVTFWALGEIVKAHLGVYDTDSAQEVQDKLDRHLTELPELEDRGWVRARLAPLVGGGADENASRAESFTAWLRFLEAMAETRPTVLVFEDLHWADESLLAFLEHLADWSSGVPLMVVGTARPELFDTHPSWGAGLRNATTISLTALSDAETAELVAALLLTVVLPASTTEAILARAGGNPLFAEEFVRVLADRGLVGPDGALDAEADLSVPDSIQALLAARLDTLSPQDKALLQDAAVVGKVFWAGALVAMGGRDPTEVAEVLHELRRKELVRPARASSMAGESELGFWHVLIRDVAYAQIPRSERMDKHEAVARWLPERAGERVEDVAEVLAHHTGTALDLAVATGHDAAAERLRPDALRFARLAAGKALGMDTTAAIRLYERALALADEDDAEYPRLLFKWAVALEDAGRLAASSDALHRALDLYSKQGDVHGQAEVVGQLSEVTYQLGEVGDTRYEEEALALLRTVPPGSQLVEAMLRLADGLYVMTEYERALEVLAEAAEVHASLDDPRPSASPKAWPLGRWIGDEAAMSRFQLGDRQSLATIEADLAADLATGGFGRGTVLAWHRLAAMHSQVHGTAAALETLAQAREWAGRRGMVEQVSMSPVWEQNWRLPTCRADDVAARLAAAMPALVANGDRLTVAVASALQAHALTEAGQFAAALEVGRPGLEVGRRIDDVELVVTACAAMAAAEHALGNAAAARKLLDEAAALLDRSGVASSPSYPRLLPGIVRCALALGADDLAARFVRPVQPNLPIREHVLVSCGALLAEAAGDTESALEGFADAQARWEAFGETSELAHAMLGAGRCQLALGRAEAAETLTRARDLFDGLGNRPRTQECDELLR